MTVSEDSCCQLIVLEVEKSSIFWYLMAFLKSLESQELNFFFDENDWNFNWINIIRFSDSSKLGDFITTSCISNDFGIIFYAK